MSLNSRININTVKLTERHTRAAEKERWRVPSSSPAIQYSGNHFFFRIVFLLVLIAGSWISSQLPAFFALDRVGLESGTLKTIFLAVLFALTWFWIFKAWRNSRNHQGDPAPEHLRELAAALEMFQAGVKPHYGALAENMGDLIGAARKEFARSSPGAVSIMLGLCGEFLRQKEMDELVRELPQMEAFRQQIAHTLERASAVHRRQAAPPAGAAG